MNEEFRYRLAVLAMILATICIVVAAAYDCRAREAEAGFKYGYELVGSTWIKR